MSASGRQRTLVSQSVAKEIHELWTVRAAWSRLAGHHTVRSGWY